MIEFPDTTLIPYVPRAFLARAWTVCAPVPAPTVKVPENVLDPAPPESAAPRVCEASEPAAPPATTSTYVAAFGTTPATATVSPDFACVWDPGRAPMVTEVTSGPATARWMTAVSTAPVEDVAVSV